MAEFLSSEWLSQYTNILVSFHRIMIFYKFFTKFWFFAHELVFQPYTESDQWYLTDVALPICLCRHSHTSAWQMMSETTSMWPCCPLTLREETSRLIGTWKFACSLSIIMGRQFRYKQSCVQSCHVRSSFTKRVNLIVGYGWFMLYYTVLYYTVLYCTVLYCTALHCTALHCTALHCTALHCTALHCTALHCTALYCIFTRLYS